MTRRIAAGSMVLLVAACASTGPVGNPPLEEVDRISFGVQQVMVATGRRDLNHPAIVCEHHAPIGSNRRQTQCITRAEKRQRMRAAEARFEDLLGNY